MQEKSKAIDQVVAGVTQGKGLTEGVRGGGVFTVECRDKDGNPEPDSELRDYENIPLKEDIHAYFAREVLPHVPDAWIDESKTKVGYEIPFNRHFYQYMPPRPLEEIEADIKTIEQDILQMLREVTA